MIHQNFKMSFEDGRDAQLENCQEGFLIYILIYVVLETKQHAALIYYLFIYLFIIYVFETIALYAPGWP